MILIMWFNRPQAVVSIEETGREHWATKSCNSVISLFVRHFRSPYFMEVISVPGPRDVDPRAISGVLYGPKAAMEGRSCGHYASLAAEK